MCEQGQQQCCLQPSRLPGCTVMRNSHCIVSLLLSHPLTTLPPDHLDVLSYMTMAILSSPDYGVDALSSPESQTQSQNTLSSFLLCHHLSTSAIYTASILSITVLSKPTYTTLPPNISTIFPMLSPPSNSSTHLNSQCLLSFLVISVSPTGTPHILWLPVTNTH